MHACLVWYTVLDMKEQLAFKGNFVRFECLHSALLLSCWKHLGARAVGTTAVLWYLATTFNNIRRQLLVPRIWTGFIYSYYMTCAVVWEAIRRLHNTGVWLFVMCFLRDICHGDVRKVVEYEWTQTLQYIYVQYTSDTVYRQPKLCHLCFTEVH